MLSVRPAMPYFSAIVPSQRPHTQAASTGFPSQENVTQRTYQLPSALALLFAGQGLSTGNLQWKPTGIRGELSPNTYKRIAQALADARLQTMEKEAPTLRNYAIVLGGDNRIKTETGLPVLEQVLLRNGFDVFKPDGIITTPALAVAAENFEAVLKQLKAKNRLDAYPHNQPSLAVIATASHNSGRDGGINAMTNRGAIIPDEISNSIQHSLQNPRTQPLPGSRQGHVYAFDAYPIYKSRLDQLGINYEAIRKARPLIVYDAMHGAAGFFFPRLLKDARIPIQQALHISKQLPVTAFPEPRAEYLQDLSAQVKKLAEQFPDRPVIGLANDGDGDRFAIIDQDGSFIEPNDVLLLLTHHMRKNRGKDGLLVRNQGTSHLLDTYAAQQGCPIVQVPVGYKFIAREFERHQNTNTPVLLGGESSGGLSVQGYTPEKDGIMANLLALEMLAQEGRPLSEVLRDIKQSLPEESAYSETKYPGVSSQKAERIIQALTEIGDTPGKSLPGLPPGFTVDHEMTRLEGQKLQQQSGTRDGIKIYLNGPDSSHAWILARKSNTEPVIRFTIEAITRKNVNSQVPLEALRQCVNRFLQTYGITPTT